jgi:cbb3-type cytochrome oxidase maturation protein
MSVIILLIGCSLFLAILFLIIFIRSAKSGQFDDDYTPSVRMLFDDATGKTLKKNQKQNTDHGA